MLTDAERALLRQDEVDAEKWRETNGYVSGICPSTANAMLAAYARFRLAAARAGERWIPVTERLPEENIPVEVHGMKRLDRSIAQRRGDEWLIETCSDLINIYPPKQWRPLLPSPPAESEEK